MLSPTKQTMKLVKKKKATEYDPEMPKLLTNLRHHEEETQNNYNHTTARSWLLYFNCVLAKNTIKVKQPALSSSVR